MVRKIVLVLALSGAADLASAQTIRGSGAHQCSVWLQARKDGGHDFDAEQWSLGYLSGFNAAQSRGQANVFTGQSESAIFAGVDGYCRAHQQDTIWSAVKAMLQQRHES